MAGDGSTLRRRSAHGPGHLSSAALSRRRRSRTPRSEDGLDPQEGGPAVCPRRRRRTTVADSSVDGVTAALSLNNIVDLDAALESCRMVLRPNGFHTFTVPHPCFDAPGTETISTSSGMRRVAGDYFAEGLWRSAHPHSVRRAGNYHRTISTYLTAVLDHGFALRSCGEPAPSDAVRAGVPHRLGLPPFLLVSARLA